MGQDISQYFQAVEDPRVVSRCDHLLSDILLIALCTYITGGSDYQDMYLFGKERGSQLQGNILRLPNGYPSADTYWRVFKSLSTDSLHQWGQLYKSTLFILGTA